MADQLDLTDAEKKLIEHIGKNECAASAYAKLKAA